MPRKNLNGRQLGERLRKIVLFILFIVMVSAFIQIIEDKRKYAVSAENYAELEEQVVKQNENSDVEEKNQELTNRKHRAPITVEFDSLKEREEAENLCGWLYVEAVDISYPILQGNDNQQYLRKNIDGEYDVGGSIFLDSENSKDYSDPNTILFGHNMADGSMFGKLKKFSLENAIEKSPYVWIITEQQEYCYKIFSVQIAEVMSECYTLFSKRGIEFGEFLNRMRLNSLIETGRFEFTGNESVLTLSTCNGDETESSRYVIQAVKVQ